MDTRTDEVIWYCGSCDATHQDGQHTRTATADQDGQDGQDTGRTADQVARAAAATADRLAGLPLPVADVVSLATRAADRAARTYRLATYGQDAADVLADVLADMLADVAAAKFPNVADVYGQTDRDQLAAVLAVRARRVADGYRRRAMRETATGTGADTVDGPTSAMEGADQDAATATANRQIRAVLARVPRNLAADRSDVLAVGDWSRKNMRAAETVLLTGQDRTAVLVAVDSTTWVPGTATQRAAWREMVDQHGQDVPTVAYQVGRVPVERVIVPAVPDVDQEGRAALRAAERDAADVLAVAERGRSTDVLSAVIAGVARDRARESRAARDAVLSHGGRAARVGIDWQYVTVDRPAPAPTVADILAAGYQPEGLAERASTNRPRGAVDAYRSIDWTAVLPGSSNTARTQLGKAARAYVDHVNGQRVHATKDQNGQTIYVAPLVPVAVHVDVLPGCPSCQDGHGQHTYQATRMLAGRRVTVETRAGGAPGRAAAARGRAARASAIARDRLADRLAVILPVAAPTVPVVTSAGVVPVPAEPTTPRPYGQASYVVGSTGETVTAATARLADWSADWRARADQVAADVATWLVDRSAAAAERDHLAGLVAVDRADRARHGYPVRATGQDLRGHVAAAMRVMVADW